MAIAGSWWIRVCLAQTKAQRIEFWIGTEDTDGHRYHYQWTSASPNEFAVNPPYDKVGELWVKAQVDPRGHEANICVGYDNHVCKHYEFDYREDHEISQDDTDDCPC